MRRLVDPGRDLREHFLDAAAPELVFAEIANALLQYVRTAQLELEDALALLVDAQSLAIDLHELAPLAAAALAGARRLELSAYDSFYAVLAEQLDLPLVTADRRLAAVAENAVLID